MTKILSQPLFLIDKHLFLTDSFHYIVGFDFMEVHVLNFGLH